MECWQKIESFHQFHSCVLAGQKKFFDNYFEMSIKKEEEQYLSDSNNIIGEQLAPSADLKIEVPDTEQLQPAKHPKKKRKLCRGNRKFICDLCYADFHLKHHLRSHILARHVKKKNKKQTCSICKESFDSLSQLGDHVRSNHGHRPIIVHKKLADGEHNPPEDGRSRFENIHNAMFVKSNEP